MELPLAIALRDRVRLVDNECNPLVTDFSGYFVDPHVVTQNGQNITLNTGQSFDFELGPAKTEFGIAGRDSQELRPGFVLVLTVNWSARSADEFDVEYDFLRFTEDDTLCHVVWRGTASRIL